MEDKKVSREYLQTYITEKNLTPDRAEKLVNDLAGKGYIIEGFNEPKPTLTQEIGSSLSKRGQDISQAAQNVQEAQTPLEKVARFGQFPLRTAGAVAGGVADVVGEVVGKGLEVTGADKVISSGAEIATSAYDSLPNFAKTAVQNLPQVKAGINAKEAYDALPKEVQQSLADIANIATAGVGGGVTKAGAKGALKVASKIPNPAEILMKGGNIAGGTVDIAQSGLSKLAEAGTDYLAKGVTEDIAKKTMQDVADRIDRYTKNFVKSNKLAQEAEANLGESVGSYLVRRGIIPQADEAGRFDAPLVVNELKKENLGLQREVSNILKQSENKTNLVQLYQKLMADVETNPKVRVGDIDSAKSYIDKFMSNAITRYGDNVTDEELYRLKIDADNGFNYNSATGDVNGAKFIADTIRGNLRKDQNLADLLDAESKNFDVINLVDKSLTGKTIGGGNLTTRLAQLGIGTTFAGGADSVIGKIISGATGVIIGDKAVDALREIAFAGPVERKIIKNYLSEPVIKKIETGTKLTKQEQTLIDKAIQPIVKTIEKGIKDFEQMPNKQGGFINPKAIAEDLGNKSLVQEAKKYKTAEEFIKAQGEPVYHGTNAKFDNFDPQKINSIEGKGDYVGEGFYFTNSKDIAKKYANQAVKKSGGIENIKDVYLKIKNPFIINNKKDIEKLNNIFGGEENRLELLIDNPKLIANKLKELGYDGLVDNLYGQRAVFNPSQIKTKSQLEQIWKESQKN